MVKRLRMLALVNAAVAAAFLVPTIFWMIADHQPRGTLNVTLPKGDRSQEFVADIEATKDIDKLRHQAKTFVEMLRVEKDYSELQSRLVRQLFHWLWIIVTACGIAFLVNAAAIWWFGKENRALGGPGAL